MDISFDNENLFDDYFDSMNLNDELKTFYQIINDEDLQEAFVDATYLIDLRNENYKRYSNVDIVKIANLSETHHDIVTTIIKLYESIQEEKILSANLERTEEIKKILDLIYNYLDELTNIIIKELRELEKSNNKRQERIKKIDYKDIDQKVLQAFLNKYNDLVLFNSTIDEDLFDNFIRQIKRKKYIDELYKLINIEVDISENEDYIKQINNEINKEIVNINERIVYLEDLIVEKSKYENEFLVFKEYFNKLIAYDDNNYTDCYAVYSMICKSLKIKSLLNYFEDSFIKEREYIRKEEQFIYEKYGIKNIKTSLDYISANYIDVISGDYKHLLDNLYKEINDADYDISSMYNKFKELVDEIWDNELTDVYSYNPSSDFAFICCNNQFIDERHECILITNKMLERVSDYSDYQIGFICNFKNNIMYITENEDIMTVDYNDMSNLKTPKQLEQEFINFKVSNRIALNGYITEISAVYFINDGDFIKYKKAVELSNQYNLPLIVLKKDKN